MTQAMSRASLVQRSCTAFLPSRHRAAENRLPSSWLSSRASSGQQAAPSGQKLEAEAGVQPDESPSAAATMGLMGLGAVGAIAVAAVGVFGVLQMALMVAQGTGRSIMADKEKQDAEREASRPKPAGSLP